jgi:hypothetical protein
MIFSIRGFGGPGLVITGDFNGDGKTDFDLGPACEEGSPL